MLMNIKTVRLLPMMKQATIAHQNNTRTLAQPPALPIPPKLLDYAVISPAKTTGAHIQWQSSQNCPKSARSMQSPTTSATKSKSLRTEPHQTIPTTTQQSPSHTVSSRPALTP